MARPGESSTSPRRLLAKQRQAQALAMRLGGAEYPEIAKALGYKAGNGAYEAVEAAIKHGFRDAAGAELLLTLGRLNRVLLAVWVPATKGDHVAIQDLLAILAERAKLLGLYPAPGSRRQERIDEELLAAEVARAARETGLSEAEVMAEALGILRQT